MGGDLGRGLGRCGWDTGHRGGGGQGIGVINNDICCLWVVIWLALGLATKAFKTSSYNTSHGRGDGCGVDVIEIHLTGLLSVLSSMSAVSQCSSGSTGADLMVVKAVSDFSSRLLGLPRVVCWLLGVS